MTVRETRLAHQLLAHKPVRPLLFDREPFLQARMESLSGTQVQRLDPLEYFCLGGEVALDDGKSGDLFTHVAPLADADLVYIADITKMLQAMAPVTTLSAINLLGTLRDRVRGSVFVALKSEVLEPECGTSRADGNQAAGSTGKSLSKSDFIALGYVLAGRDLDASAEPGAESSGDEETDAVELFRYCLRDYKAVPGWLNSKYWANPERWNVTE